MAHFTPRRDGVWLGTFAAQERSGLINLTRYPVPRIPEAGQ
jgi:hypothetical protein